MLPWLVAEDCEPVETAVGEPCRSIPDFCEKRCPICTRARQGIKLARLLARLETAVTFGGCPWGRARQRKYGVKPSELLPAKSESNRDG